jgi:small subunit ribosomal protein S1
MVDQSPYQEFQEGAPPLDESWWQAILAEEEKKSNSSEHNHSHNQKYRVDESINLPTDLTDDAIDWDKATRLYNLDETILLNVTGYNRGGLLVNGEGLYGFVPLSHLLLSNDEKSNPEECLNSRLDQTLRLKIIECDLEHGRIVFSERAAKFKPGARNHILQKIKVGDRVYGTVTNITDFGIFLDLGGVEGLIHVSEISWGRVRHPEDTVSLGQNLEVLVINVNHDEAHIALSMKRLHPNPWETIDLHYSPGQVIDAVVTSIVPFGAFARLEEGLDGLIHISEMCQSDNVSHPEEILQVGENIRVRILHIDPSRQRLGLSLNLNNDDNLTN